LAWWWLAWWRRLARQRPTSRLVRARRGWFRVARRCRCGLRLARLARTEICRRRRGLVGLAPHLGLGRLPLGVGSRFICLGQPLGRRFNRRHRGPTVDCCAPTDLCGTSADCRRNPLYSPAARRSRPATHHRCSLGPAIAPPPIGPLLGAAVPPPIVVLPPPEIVLAVAPPLIIFGPPSFAFFVGPPVLAFATIGREWWHGGFVDGGFAAAGAGAAIAHFGHAGAGFTGTHRGWHTARSHWANTWHDGRFGRGHNGGFGGWHGGGFAGWHGAGFGGWHEARGGGGFGGGHGHGH